VICLTDANEKQDIAMALMVLDIDA